jgi:hypothetical protein
MDSGTDIDTRPTPAEGTNGRSGDGAVTVRSPRTRENSQGAEPEITDAESHIIRGED